jgi:acylphosphatase
VTGPTANRAAATPIRLEATVRGRVQGVGFRYFVVRRATERGLTGWVANEADGSVRCVAEGAPDAIDALEDILRRGPMGAIVEGVSAVRMPATGEFAGFSVRSGGHRGD